MQLARSPSPAGGHRNAFGFLRLLFASLVIVSHVPEIVDNGRARELLYRLTGTMSLGDLAVYGFLVISGYLVTGSSVSTATRREYLLKRVARIYPAFALASLVCVFVVGPAAGGQLPGGLAHTVLASLAHIAILARPTSQGAFAGQHYSDWLTALDGAMWTIQYEFLCYLLVLWLVAVPERRRPVVTGGVAAALLTVASVLPPSWALQLGRPIMFPANLATMLALIGMFFSGATFRLIGEKVALTNGRALFATAALAATIVHPVTAVAGCALFGTYLIVHAARRGASSWLGRVNGVNDISYGVYLYAWPIEQLLIRAGAGSDLLLLGMATWLGAVGAGWLSWLLVERPVKRWVDRPKAAAA